MVYGVYNKTDSNLGVGHEGRQTKPTEEEATGVEIDEVVADASAAVEEAPVAEEAVEEAPVAEEAAEEATEEAPAAE